VFYVTRPAKSASGVKVTRKIGEGVYGEVYSATHDGQSVALKVISSTCLSAVIIHLDVLVKVFLTVGLLWMQQQN